jgi:hypothetical protein
MRLEANNDCIQWRILSLHGEYLFICSLFNDLFSVTKITASNAMVIREWWIGEDLEGSGRGVILK